MMEDLRDGIQSWLAVEGWGMAPGVSERDFTVAGLKVYKREPPRSKIGIRGSALISPLWGV